MPSHPTQYPIRLTGFLCVWMLCLFVCTRVSAEAAYLVTISEREDISRIEAAGLSVDRIKPDGVAVVYVPEGRLKQLESLGLPYELVPDYLTKAPSGYRSYSAITADLQQYAVLYPDITRLISLGQSVQGRELWAILITTEPELLQDKPAVKYVSTMHGDEPLGTEMCMFFIDLLLDEYGSNSRITRLLDNTYVWVVPLMNPDGYETYVRFNANNVDLNRAFPQYLIDFTADWYHDEFLNIEVLEPEVRHIISWSLEHAFVLSANIHTGEVVVNYPYDDGVTIPSGTAAPTPDENLFRELSRRYADHHPIMANNTSLLLGFNRGIVNGSRWYRITGSMQDWHYRYLGCKEVTLELSVTKAPLASQLPTHWEYNAEAMLSYLEGVYQGVNGTTTDRRSGDSIWAQVAVADNTRTAYTHPETGYYHRLLQPGIYSVEFSAPGYIPYTLNDVTVTTDTTTRNDITLSDGDINLDGRVDAVDIQLVVNAILGYVIPYDADVDGGGGVSATDLQSVINKVLGY